jgi:predicted Zn-ribbon and HTH transcriptional regulator
MSFSDVAMHEEAAINLWKRFAPANHTEWANEPHKVVYRDAAAAVLDSSAAVLAVIMESHRWVVREKARLQSTLTEVRRNLPRIRNSSQALREVTEAIDRALPRRAATTFCRICGGEFDKAEWEAAGTCPECEEPKECAGRI